MISLAALLLRQNTAKARKTRPAGIATVNITTLVKIKKAIENDLPYDDSIDLDNTGASAFKIDQADFDACMAFLTVGTIPPKYAGGVSNG